MTTIDIKLIDLNPGDQVTMLTNDGVWSDPKLERKTATLAVFDNGTRWYLEVPANGRWNPGRQRTRSHGHGHIWPLGHPDSAGRRRREAISRTMGAAVGRATSGLYALVGDFQPVHKVSTLDDAEALIKSWRERLDLMATAITEARAELAGLEAQA